MARTTWAFNKEIIFGEIGAFLGVPLFSFIASQLTKQTSIISASAVGGSIIGAVIFYLSMRIYDRKKQENYGKKELFNDLSYFTPVALMLTLLVYYPILYFVSNYLLNKNTNLFLSVIPSQLIAFAVFLVAINIYRFILIKYFGKVL